MRLIQSIVVSVVLGCASIAQAEGDQVFGFRATDQTMNTAIETATATLPLFFANATDADGYGVPGANLKVAFEVQNQGETQMEIIWVSPFRRFDNGTFAGLLANEPNYMPGLRAGDRVDFSQDMLRDWSLWTESGTSFGNFTTRVIATQMGEAGADLRAKMNDPAVPDAWR